MILVSCDETTGSLGVPATADLIASDTASFTFTTRSVLLDSVVGNSSVCYLGRVFDYETQTNIQADFLAQFSCLENYMSGTNLEGLDKNPVVDSCDIRLYFESYKGDADNPMKIYVYPVDSNKIIREDITYYSNINLSNFINESAGPIATKMFSVVDYSILDAERMSSAYTPNVHIVLPNEYGMRLLKLAAAHPEYFKNSWSFIHYVCPGFVFKLKSGFGTMLTLMVSTFDVDWHYMQDDNTEVAATFRFSATPEVIQSTSVQNGSLEHLKMSGVDYTYLKTPAGVATEITFPVDEIYAKHENDSVSKARISLMRYNSSYDSEYDPTYTNLLNANYLSVPQTVLMVRKSKMREFFDKRKVADSETSFTTTFSDSYNCYTFENIARLLSFMYHDKQGVMEREHLSSAEFNQRYPDWNKVLLVPVTVATTTNTSLGVSAQSSVSNDFSVTSTRLVGGTKPISMSVIYSRYKVTAQ